MAPWAPGVMQVTYDGHRLYFFVKDSPGTALGQDVHAFGGTFETVPATGS
jgi:predicted lipoprotein with Yx(FWY)xxD motif